MKQGVEELVAGFRDAVTVGRVFGEPFEKNGVTVIPAASVMGGGGGGRGEAPDGSDLGSGSGFGLVGRSAGAYVIRGDEVKWEPAIDVNRIVAGAFVLMALKLIFGRRRRRQVR